MKKLVAAVAAGAGILATASHADTVALSHISNPAVRFSDALNAQDLAIEALMNTAADGTKSGVKKGDVKDKALGTVFGVIKNNQGAPLCGLTLANGQFMFSCSPAGTYSIDTVTDGQGLVTLFGFVDGHFPYKVVLNGFGRWDMTLNVASSQQQPVNSTITFNLTDGCNNGVSTDYKFYDVTNNLVWPSATTHYSTTAYNATYSHNLSCSTGAKVCYGARNTGFYWGIDVDGSKSCSDCCITCSDGNTMSRRLTC
ncbi:MAG TPA: hypothetical protein VFP36_07210 [Usitatibacter sp.]|nr:hypothetical protein [Usitatibacter sp.]